MNRSIEQEKKELDVLIGRGMSFEVEQTFFRRRKGLKGYFSKREKVTETVKYFIQEPTLSTLDRIAAEQVELVIDENIMSSETGINEARRLTADHSMRMAKIIAIAVLGEDYVKPIEHGGGYRYHYDDKRLKELTKVFFTFIRPSKLFKLTLMVNTISNLGDFTNSIRLMSANRTMMPIRIEENNEG